MLDLKHENKRCGGNIVVLRDVLYSMGHNTKFVFICRNMFYVKLRCVILRMRYCNLGKYNPQTQTYTHTLGASKNNHS